MISPPCALCQLPGFILIPLWLLGGAGRFTQAGDLRPAPQAFRQEVAIRVPAPAGMPAGGLTRVVVAGDGSVRVSDGQRWFDLREGLLTALPAAVAPETDPARTELAGHEIRQIARSPGGRAMAATDRGLWERGPTGSWARVPVIDGAGCDWATGELRGVGIDSTGAAWVALPSAVACRRKERWELYTGREGLPGGDITCVAAGPDGEVWFGTRRGAVRFEGGAWAYREGPRWLPGNDVRAVAVGRRRHGLVRHGPGPRVASSAGR